MIVDANQPKSLLILDRITGKRRLYDGFTNLKLLSQFPFTATQIQITQVLDHQTQRLDKYDLRSFGHVHKITCCDDIDHARDKIILIQFEHID